MITKTNVFDKLPSPVIKLKRAPALIKAQEKYYFQNKDKIVKKQMEYNETYFKQMMLCSCGIHHTRAAKYAHIRSPRHFPRLENIKNGKLAGSKIGDERIECACGGHYLFKLRAQHFKTQKHNKHIEWKKQKEYEEAKHSVSDNTKHIPNVNEFTIKEI